MKVHFFDSIKIPLPKDRIYSRLGYAKGKTHLSPEQKSNVDQHIEEALDFIDLKGAGLRVAIEAIEPLKVKLTSDIVLKSNSLAQLFRDCQEVLFMGATAGSRVIKAIKEKSAGSDVACAVIFDAVASEMVDSSLDWITNYFSYELRRENKEIGKQRFSAGYGDFTLDNQKLMYDILQLRKLEVTLTEQYILIPEKSVTAVVGIKET